MAFAKGTPKPANSGRRKGHIAKAKVIELSVREILAREGHDPVAQTVKIANGEVPCQVCRGKGKTKFQPATRKQTAKCQTCFGTGRVEPTGEAMFPKTCPTCDGTGWHAERTETQLGERTCQSCYGRGKEIISPELMLKANTELMKYQHPQLKQVEHHGPEGGPMQARIAIEYVAPKPEE